MDTAVELLEKVKALGVTLTRSDDKLLLEPGSKVPQDLIRAIRAHKNEILSILARPKLAEGSPQWHAETIAKAVEREGVCIFWSQLFAEMIAFIKDDTFKSRVPCGIVSYTSQELKELFGNGKPELTAKDLRLIHEGKKTGGGHIISHEPKGSK
jgi:hypothetical protein